METFTMHDFAEAFQVEYKGCDALPYMLDMHYKVTSSSFIIALNSCHTSEEQKAYLINYCNDERLIMRGLEHNTDIIQDQIDKLEMKYDSIIRDGVSFPVSNEVLKIHHQFNDDYNKLFDELQAHNVKHIKHKYLFDMVNVAIKMYCIKYGVSLTMDIVNDLSRRNGEPPITKIEY